MQELKYTAKAIRNLERLSGKPFINLLSDYSMDTVVLLVQAGLGENMDDDDALNYIDAYLENKEGLLEDLYITILEGIQGAGFLPSLLNLEEMKRALKAPA